MEVHRSNLRSVKEVMMWYRYARHDEEWGPWEILEPGILLAKTYARWEFSYGKAPE